MIRSKEPLLFLGKLTLVSAFWATLAGPVYAANEPSAVSSSAAKSTIWVWDHVKAPQWKVTMRASSEEQAEKTVSRLNGHEKHGARVFVLTDGRVPDSVPQIPEDVLLQEAPAGKAAAKRPHQKSGSKKGSGLPIAAGEVSKKNNLDKSEALAIKKTSSRPVDPEIDAVETGTKSGSALLRSEPVRDLGKQTSSARLQAEFEILNNGEGQLQLSLESRSCDCIEVEIDGVVVATADRPSSGPLTPVAATSETARSTPGSERVIQVGPNKVVRVKMTVVAEGPRGTFTRSIKLRTSDRAQSSIELTLVADLKLDVELSATSIQFGDLRSGHSTEKVTLITSNNPKLQLEDLRSSDENVTVRSERMTAAELSAAGKISGYKVVATFTAKELVGPIQGEMMIRTNVPGSREMHVPMSGRATSANFWKSCPVLDLGQVPAMQEVSRGMFLRLRSDRPVQVRVTRTGLPGLNVLPTVMTDNGGTTVVLLDVQVTREVPAGRLDGVIELETNVPGAKRVLIPMTGSFGDAAHPQTASATESVDDHTVSQPTTSAR